MLIKRTTSKVCSAFNYFAVGDQRFVYTNEIIVLGDVSVGKHDRYKEKTTYMV